ncbi:MAG: HEAT repeat domain-containing protein [Candidatus Rifleibacteriota bacterium]
MKKNVAKDLGLLNKKIKKLNRMPVKKIKESVCDIIDLKGFGLALLLRKLPEFSPKRQYKIARKIEDFLYFHPADGAKLLNRLRVVCRKCDKQSLPLLLAAYVDVWSQAGKNEAELLTMQDKAYEVLKTNADLTRKGKATEIIGKSDDKRFLKIIIKNMIKASKKVGDFSGYHFIENSLLVVKKLGGETVLRLLINPNSDNIIKKMRIEWSPSDANVMNSLIRISHDLTDDFAQTLLKVVDLSDFNLPFASMIQEGLDHPDKWVRQTAAASMEKISKSVNPELLKKMLGDSSPEVRLMAISSLGGFSREQTGELLETLARESGDTAGMRLNALYALHAQKNLPALERLTDSPDSIIALNAMGLAALLSSSRRESLEKLLDVYLGLKPDRGIELQRYLLELAEPEDLRSLIALHKTSESSLAKENCVELIKLFMIKKSGPRLEKVKTDLPESERKAVELLAA